MPPPDVPYVQAHGFLRDIYTLLCSCVSSPEIMQWFSQAGIRGRVASACLSKKWSVRSTKGLSSYQMTCVG